MVQAPPNRELLQKLRKLYGYDMAMFRQSGRKISQQDELESLAIHHLDKQVIAAVQEFMDSVGEAENMDKAAIAVLMRLCGVLLADIHNKKGADIANSAIKFGRRYLAGSYKENINNSETKDQ